MSGKTASVCAEDDLIRALKNAAGETCFAGIEDTLREAIAEIERLREKLEELERWRPKR